MDAKKQLECSFCGKSASQVAKLVAGGKGHICNTCAAEAHRIMSGAAAPTGSGPLARLFARLKRWRWPHGQTFDALSSV